jgi:hypothetical protein
MCAWAVVWHFYIIFNCIGKDQLWALGVPDEGYSRNTLCALNLIFTFVFQYMRLNNICQCLNVVHQWDSLLTFHFYSKSYLIRNISHRFDVGCIILFFQKNQCHVQHFTFSYNLTTNVMSYIQQCDCNKLQSSLSKNITYC